MNKEKGAILVFLALILSVLILFLALGIDTALLGSSHQKQSRTAELGALAAIEAFLLSEREDLNPQERINAAVQRAEEVVGFELNRIVSQANINQTDSGDDDPIRAGEASDGPRGTLQPGQHFFCLLYTSPSPRDRG